MKRIASMCIMLFGGLLYGQVSIVDSNPVIESFAGFTGIATPANWTVQGTGTRGTTWNGTNQTGGTSGGWYGNVNVSFLGSSSASNGNATWFLQNNTGGTIYGFTLSFLGQLFKSGTASPSVTVSWQNSSSSTNPSQGALANPFSSLTFNDATLNISTGTTLSETVSGLSLANNDYIFIRFIHSGGTNSDNLGWDDVSFTPNLTAPLPVELISFTSNVKEDKVTLSWSTATEVNDYGFEIQRSAIGSRQSTWQKIGFVQGSGNSNSLKNYSFTDEPMGGKEFQYRLKQIDFNGAFEYSEITTAVLENVSMFKLDQNFPNPFNPTTKISYTVPVKTHVKLRVYDLLAQVVAELANSMHEAGRYEVTFDGSNLPSGAYFYKVEAGDYVEVKKLLLIK